MRRSTVVVGYCTAVLSLAVGLILGTIATANAQTESPSPTPEPSPSCDPYAGLVDAATRNGCVVEVAPSEAWAYGLLLGLVLIVACLAALVVGQLRRSS